MDEELNPEKHINPTGQTGRTNQTNGDETSEVITRTIRRHMKVTFQQSFAVSDETQLHNRYPTCSSSYNNPANVMQHGSMMDFVPLQHNSASLQEVTVGTKCIPNYPVPLPICKLTYFHGKGAYDTFLSKVTQKGSYLLFLNVHNNYVPTILIRDESDVVTAISVNRSAKDYFYFLPADLENRFTTIGSLICHHSDNIDANNPKLTGVVFRREIRCEEYDAHLIVEPQADLTTWIYRVAADIWMDQIFDMLKNSGDYVLVADRPEDNRIFVRWYDKVKVVSFSQNNRGQWTLPKGQRFEPLESVETLDVYIKSLAMIRHAVDGVCFIKPVLVNVTQSGEQRSTQSAVNAPFHLESLNNAPHFTNDNDTLIGANYPPRPLHALPFYCGKLKTDAALKHLERTGDYMVFVNKEDKCLYLATSVFNNGEEAMYYCYKIKKTEQDNFIIKFSDAACEFGTVDELVKHYAVNNLPLNTPEVAANCSVTLQRPIRTDIFSKEFETLQSSDATAYRWNHGFLDDKRTDKKLKNCGDYLFRLSEDGGDMVLTVKWQNAYMDFTTEPDKHCMYQLARSDPIEPLEYAIDYLDYVKSSVFGMTQFDHVVLKHCIPTKQRRNEKKKSNHLARATTF